MTFLRKLMLVGLSVHAQTQHKSGTDIMFQQTLPSSALREPVTVDSTAKSSTKEEYIAATSLKNEYILPASSAVKELIASIMNSTATKSLTVWQSADEQYRQVLSDSGIVSTAQQARFIRYKNTVCAELGRLLNLGTIERALLDASADTSIGQTNDATTTSTSSVVNETQVDDPELDKHHKLAERSALLAIAEVKNEIRRNRSILLLFVEHYVEALQASDTVPEKVKNTVISYLASAAEDHNKFIKELCRVVCRHGADGHFDAMFNVKIPVDRGQSVKAKIQYIPATEEVLLKLICKYKSDAYSVSID